MSDYRKLMPQSDESARVLAANSYIEESGQALTCDLLAVYKVLGIYPHFDLGGVVYDISPTEMYNAEILRESPNVARVSLSVRQDFQRSSVASTKYRRDENTGEWYSIGESVPPFLLSNEFKVPGITAIVLNELRKRAMPPQFMFNSARQRVQR